MFPRMKLGSKSSHSVCCKTSIHTHRTRDQGVKDVSAESSAATDVIPLVIGVKHALDKQHGAADNEKRNN